MHKHDLPLDSLDWTTFQKFCTDLLKVEKNTIDSREYLQSGSKQDGIDIYVTKRDSEKLIVAQCKKKKYISPSEINKIIDLFLKGKFKDKTNEFILCTSFNFSAKEKHEVELDSIRTRLKLNNIELRIWDFDGINTLLRGNSSDKYIAIVYHYFRHDITIEFYGTAYSKYIESLNLPKRRKYDFNITDYIVRNAQILNDNQTHRPTSLQEVIKHKFDSSSLVQIILAASAGVGKSIELKNCVNFINSSYKDIFPIYADLRNYNGEELDIFLFGSDTLNNNIPNDRLFIFLDGLDEVSPDLFHVIIKKINSFIQRKPTNFLLSVRTNFIDKNNSPISNANLYLLENLTKGDIKNYIIQQLSGKSEIFIAELYKYKLFDYCYTPFYLVNLIDFYKNGNFPKNRSDLLKCITLKNLHRDIERYSDKEKINSIFSISKKIAFLSSLIGKTAISTHELEQFDINKDSIQLLGNLSIIEKNTSTFSGDKWFFKHKNIQEYLTAEILSTAANVDLVLDLLFVKENGLKQVSQRMMNILSFLISNESISEGLFNTLLTELIENDPEVLLEFESDKLTIEVKDAIFFKIWSKYKTNGLSLYSSSKFTLQDFASFCIIDKPKVKFLLNEVEFEKNIGLIRNALVLLISDSHTPPIKEVITSTLNRVLYNNQTSNSIKGHILETLHGCKILSKLNFTDYLKSDLDVKNIQIRESFLRIIKAEKMYGYNDFILESIEVFESDISHIYDHTVSYYIKDTLCNPQIADDLTVLLKYLITNPNKIDYFQESEKIIFESYELDTLFTNAIPLATKDKRIIPLVYKLMLKLEMIEFEYSIFDLFIQFFKQLDISNIIFEKSLKWKRTLYFCTSFLSLKNIPYLEELAKSNEQSKTTLTAILSICYKQDEILFEEIKKHWKLNEGYEFPTFEKAMSRDEIKAQNDLEKQSMLLNRNLFIEEVTNIFTNYGSNEIRNYLDLIKSGKVKDLNSLALKEIGRWSRKNHLTLNEFTGRYSDQKIWGDFKINSIMGMLRERNRSNPIDDDLLLFAKDWCLTKINKDEFEDCFTQGKNGDFDFNREKLRIFELYKMLRFKMSDEMYFKLLLYDLYPPMTSNSITQFILENTQDIEKLKQKITYNLQNKKLPQNILLNHIYIGKELNISGIIDIAYNELLKRKDLTSQSKIHLSRFYLNLGGELEDIIDENIIKLRILNNDSDISFEWYIFVTALQKEYDWACSIVDTLVFQIEKFETHIRSKLINYLFTSNKDNAIRTWISESIKISENILSDKLNNNVNKHIKELNHETAITSLINGLKEIYSTIINDNFDNHTSIYQAVISNLNTLIENNPDAFSYLTLELHRIKSDFPNNGIKEIIQNQILTFNNHYFNTKVTDFSIKDAKEIFSAITDEI